MTISKRDIKISVITVCYNSADTIETAIQSVLSQDYPNTEYIIVDGKSTDNTPAIISNYGSRISKIISGKDNGIYDAVNKGIREATGDVAGVLHSDDFFAGSNVISLISERFSSGSVDGVFSDLQYVSKKNPARIIRKWKAGTYLPGMFDKGWMPPHPTFYVKRNMFDQFGYYNVGLKFAADYELMLRFIHKNKIRIEYIPEVLVKMRIGGKGNVTLMNRLRANAEDKKAWEINDLKPPSFIRFRKPLSKLRQYW